MGISKALKRSEQFSALIILLFHKNKKQVFFTIFLIIIIFLLQQNILIIIIHMLIKNNCMVGHLHLFHHIIPMEVMEDTILHMPTLIPMAHFMMKMVSLPMIPMMSQQLQTQQLHIWPTGIFTLIISIVLIKTLFYKTK